MIDSERNQQGYLSTDSYGEAACQADVEVRKEIPNSSQCPANCRMFNAQKGLGLSFTLRRSDWGMQPSLAH